MSYEQQIRDEIELDDTTEDGEPPDDDVLRGATEPPMPTGVVMGEHVYEDDYPALCRYCGQGPYAEIHTNQAIEPHCRKA